MGHQELARPLVSITKADGTLGIVAIAKHLYGADKYKNMILELNASDDRGINVVRE